MKVLKYQIIKREDTTGKCTFWTGKTYSEVEHEGTYYDSFEEAMMVAIALSDSDYSDCSNDFIVVVLSMTNEEPLYLGEVNASTFKRCI